MKAIDTINEGNRWGAQLRACEIIGMIARSMTRRAAFYPCRVDRHLVDGQEHVGLAVGDEHDEDDGQQGGGQVGGGGGVRVLVRVQQQERDEPAARD